MAFPVELEPHTEFTRELKLILNTTDPSVYQVLSPNRQSSGESPALSSPLCRPCQSGECRLGEFWVNDVETDILLLPYTI